MRLVLFTVQVLPWPQSYVCNSRVYTGVCMRFKLRRFVSQITWANCIWDGWWVLLVKRERGRAGRGQFGGGQYCSCKVGSISWKVWGPRLIQMDGFFFLAQFALET